MLPSPGLCCTMKSKGMSLKLHLRIRAGGRVSGLLKINSIALLSVTTTNFLPIKSRKCLSQPQTYPSASFSSWLYLDSTSLSLRLASDTRRFSLKLIGFCWLITAPIPIGLASIVRMV